MNGISVTLRALYRGEFRLANELAAAAERHSAEHGIHYVAMDLAQWSDQHHRQLADVGRNHGLELEGSPEQSSPGPVPAGLETPFEAVGHAPEPGLVLLCDLHRLHLGAVSNSLYWEMLAQAAQATEDIRLLRLATACHPRTLRQMRWTNTMLKDLAAQALTSV
ncbi:hypothetical protein [Streptomyces sp. NPDC102437]|uniref:hypothetical protein n=1 Tax=Streptomyces sp. NPDC102437 TaxID=3366175 RepID=UPI00380D707E